MSICRCFSSVNSCQAEAKKAGKAEATPKASPKGNPENVKLEAAIKAKAEKLGYKDSALPQKRWYLRVYIYIDR